MVSTSTSCVWGKQGKHMYDQRSGHIQRACVSLRINYHHHQGPCWLAWAIKLLNNLQSLTVSTNWFSQPMTNRPPWTLGPYDHCLSMTTVSLLPLSLYDQRLSMTTRPNDHCLSMATVSLWPPYPYDNCLSMTTRSLWPLSITTRPLWPLDPYDHWILMTTGPLWPPGAYDYCLSMTTRLLWPQTTGPLWPPNP